MRKVALAVLLMAATASQANGPQRPPIDLDRAGAMEALERENPDHYYRIGRILYLATRMPCNTDTFSRTLRARFEARDAACSLLLMTSYPSKRQLAFTLGETREPLNKSRRVAHWLCGMGCAKRGATNSQCIFASRATKQTARKASARKGFDEKGPGAKRR
jgi:hypothetical protein